MALDGIAIVANGTLIANGSAGTFVAAPGQLINVIVNLTNAPTGTNPALVVTVSELDPGNGTTVIQSVSTASLTGTGVTVLSIGLKSSSIVQVSWTVTGTTPSFTGVYITALAREASLLDKFGNAVHHTFAQAVTLGFVPGALSGRANGYVAAATTAQFAVRGSTYAAQASAGQRSIVSSNASDASAGIGARTVTINYLNNAMQLKQDVVTLNGTTAVNTNATDIQFVESMVVATCGSNLTNVGNVQMMTGLAGAGSVMAQINASDGSTFYAHHYVPAGVTCYVIKAEGAGTLSAGKSWLNRTGDPRASNLPTLQIGDITVHSGGFEEDHDYHVPLAVPGPDLIFCKEQPIAANASNFAFASFDYFQV